MTPTLSKTVLSVVRAYEKSVDAALDSDDMSGLAAAFRVAAEQLRLDPEDNSPLGALLSCKEQLFAIAAEITRETPSPQPVRDLDGTIHESILRVSGKSFFCTCGCNVFHQPNEEEPELYQCNGCGSQFLTS
jgi:hypothetical protein